MKQSYVNLACKADTCALAGASAFFLGIKDSVIVINGSTFCCNLMRRFLERGFRKFDRANLFCTELKEDSVIFGNGENLKKILKKIYADYKPSVIFIQNNCAASLIGDDLEGIAREIPFECPICVLDGGGIKGTFKDGYIQAAKVFLRKCKGLEKTTLNMAGVEELGANVSKYSLNLVGLTPGYYNYINDRRELQRLLEMANIEVLNVLSDNIDMQSIGLISKAQLNLVIHEELGLELAKELEDLWGMPYLVQLPPYGFEGSKDGLLQVCRALGMNQVELQQVEAKVDAELAVSYTEVKELSFLHGDIWIDEINVAGPRSVVLGLAEALRKELVNYETMNLFIYDDKERENTEFYNFHSSFDATKLSAEANSFTFSSFSEHIRLIKEHPEKDGYACIAYPSFDSACMFPLMGLAGAKKLTELLWQFYINNSLMKRLTEDLDY